MEYIQEEEFYHIQAMKHYNTLPSWKKDETHFIGEKKNPFFGYYDNYAHNVRNPINNTSYPLNVISNWVVKHNTEGLAIPEELKLFYHCNPVQTMCELHDCVTHYTMLVRELVFEEVRKDFFPQLPSRQKGIWVIPINESTSETVKYWWSQVSNGNSQIIKLRLTGKIHQASSEWLTARVLPLDVIKQNAFKYWTGASSGRDLNQVECIFEGFATVIDFIKPSDFNI